MAESQSKIILSRFKLIQAWELKFFHFEPYKLIFYTKSQTWIIIQLAIPKLDHVYTGMIGVSKISQLKMNAKRKLYTFI